MNYINKYTSKIIILSIITLSIFSCKQQVNKATSISVSILPQKYIIEKLLGPSTLINVLIPKGSSPATYSPTPIQIKNLSQSEIYLRIGHIGFEQAWTDRISEINPDLKIIDTSEGISFIRGEDHVHGDHVHKGGIDPHIWTSPKTMLIVLENTKKALLENFPDKKETILSESTKLKALIESIDKEFMNKCNSFASKKFYIFHPAYTYMARDYALEQISIEHKGKEPSAQWIRKLIDNGRAQNIKAIFIQEEFDIRNAELIANELNIPIVQVKPLAEQWDLEMRNVLSKLEKALQ